MKELLLLPLSIIGEIFEEILGTGVDACPPLLLFLLAVCLFMNSGLFINARRHSFGNHRNHCAYCLADNLNCKSKQN